MSSGHFRKVMACLSGLGIVCILGGCAKQPVRIGFAEELTGTHSDLGVPARNGAQLAVERINASGGINGRPIELVIVNDKGTAEGVRVADRQLIKSGVVAIIGHATSQQTKEALPIINAEHTILISPTATADELTTEGGYFFRAISGNRAFSSGFARSIYKRHGPLKMAIIYDTVNLTSTEAFRRNFTSEYESLGGKVVDVVSFSSRAKTDFAPLLEKFAASHPEGLLIIANSYDAALIAQRVRLAGWNIPLFSSGLAEVKGLIEFGGKAVEGMEVVEHYDLNSRSPEFQDFRARYRSRYGIEPVGYAALGYETVEVLATALKKTGGNAKGLRETLLKTRNYRGLVSTFSFDKSGGAMRPSYVVTIRNNKPVTVDITEPQKTGGE